MSVLRSPEDYELFLYTLAERFRSIRQSTVLLARRGATLGRVSGELFFDDGYRITVRERILFDRLPATIDWMVTSFGVGRKSSAGTIRSRIPMIQLCNPPIHITSTSRLI